VCPQSPAAEHTRCWRWPVRSTSPSRSGVASGHLFSMSQSNSSFRCVDRPPATSGSSSGASRDRSSRLYERPDDGVSSEYYARVLRAYFRPLSARIAANVVDRGAGRFGVRLPAV
jgi:hypothetical protein